MSNGPKKKSDGEKSLLATMSWACTNFGQTSEIDAYVEETGSWETVAEAHAVEGIIDAEDIASFIVRSVNQAQEMQASLKQALVSLEACLACRNIDAKIKTPAEKAIQSIKKIMG